MVKESGTDSSFTRAFQGRSVETCIERFTSPKLTLVLPFVPASETMQVNTSHSSKMEVIREVSLKFPRELDQVIRLLLFSRTIIC